MTQQKADPICHYCIVRTDVMVGLASANLLHAAGESSDGTLTPGTYAVALGVPNESALIRLATNLEAAGVQIYRIVESEGLYAGQLMAIGIKPGLKSERGRYLSTLPLLRLNQFKEYKNYDAGWSEKLQQANHKLEQVRKQLLELKQERALPWTQRLRRWWNRKEQVV